MLYRQALALSLFPLAACSGEVKLSDAGPFGPAYASWMHLVPSDSHHLVVTNVPSYCEKFQAWQAASLAHTKRHDKITINDTDYCAKAEDVTLDLARASDALYFEGAHYITLVLDDGGLSAPDADTYEVGSQPSLSGTMRYFGSSPWAVVSRDWDATATYDEGCGVDSEDLDEDTDAWSFADGELQITNVAEEATASGVLEAKLVEEDGDDGGEAEARLTAHYCAIIE